MSLVRPTVALLMITLLLPAITQADPIAEGPRSESLVEGHTVFLTIDALPFDPEGARATPSPRASAATSGPATQSLQERWIREPGVLWFNDQFLTTPLTQASEGLGSGTIVTSQYAASVAVLVRAADGTGIREPCGGAVMLVNQGDPDPRMLLVGLDGKDPLSGDAAPRAVVDLQTTAQGSGIEAVGAQTIAGGGDLAGFDYEESYRVTDPNEHTWIIDKYVAGTRLTLDGAETTYAFPVWVANLLGSPVFVPDDQATTNEACRNVSGMLANGAPAVGATCSIGVPGHALAQGGSTDITVDPIFSSVPWRDEPCMDRAEPSRGNQCYQGSPAEDTDGDFDLDRDDCDPQSIFPVRRYQGLLYVRWEDLSAEGSPVDHSRVWYSTQTNGCQVGTEWRCAADDDNAEGNSHSFHPSTPSHAEAQSCLVGGPDPVNHGGSTAGSAGLCDYAHALRQVDVYFSGSGRPAEPVSRHFVVDELEGSSAPFFDFHAAFPPP